MERQIALGAALPPAPTCFGCNRSDIVLGASRSWKPQTTSGSQEAEPSEDGWRFCYPQVRPWRARRPARTAASPALQTATVSATASRQCGSAGESGLAGHPDGKASAATCKGPKGRHRGLQATNDLSCSSSIEDDLHRDRKGVAILIAVALVDPPAQLQGACLWWRRCLLGHRWRWWPPAACAPVKMLRRAIHPGLM